MRRRGLLLAGVLGFICAAPAENVAVAQQANEHFGLTDLDKSGRIDRPEYQRRMVEVFYFADGNKDGVVTVEELTVIETVDRDAVKSADKSGDSKLTVNEFVTYRIIQFDEADTNKDGVLVIEEVQAWERR